MSHHRHKTLVIHTGGIGDLILSCPAIAALGAEHPVDMLGRPDRAALLHSAGMAHHVHSIEQAGFESVFSTPNAQLQELMRPYGQVVAWMSDPDGAITRGLHACGIENTICFHGLPPATWPKHASSYYMHCVGFDPDAVPTRLKIKPAQERHDVIIHPGSGSPRKNWPLARFQAVAAELEAMGRRVCWCIGPAEEESGIGQGLRTLRFESLVELGHALAASRLYIGNDSGITHLAAAVGCPTVAIFGVTDPAVWAPLGDHVSVVSAEEGWPDAEAVLQTVTAQASS